jgi:putative nucleotidyltransferase with HDIG domain
MKKVRVDELKPNMILAETILGRGGSILLSTGIKLNDNLIDKIKETGKKTIYIEDEKSEVKIDGVADLDGEKIHFDSKVDIDEHLNTELMQKVEAEFEQVANTVKDGILNLNLSEEEIIKNTGDVTEFIKENFNSNYAYIFRSIMTMRDVDEYLYRHSVNVAVLSFLLAKWLGYNDEKLNKILYAGLLHDIGKLKVDQKVLNKPGKLTEEEFEIVKNMHFIHIKY